MSIIRALIMNNYFWVNSCKTLDGTDEYREKCGNATRMRTNTNSVHFRHQTGQNDFGLNTE